MNYAKHPPKRIYLFEYEGDPDQWVWCQDDNSETGRPVLVYELKQVRPTTDREE